MVGVIFITLFFLPIFQPAVKSHGKCYSLAITRTSLSLAERGQVFHRKRGALLFKEHHACIMLCMISGVQCDVKSYHVSFGLQNTL